MDASDRYVLFVKSLVIVAVCTGLRLIYSIISTSPTTAIPRVGIAPGLLNWRTKAAKAQFYADGKRLLDEGYARFKRSLFVVQTSDVPRIVLSTKYLEELRSASESELSHRESVADRFLGYWSGLGVVRQSHLHNEVCQTTLVRHLPLLMPSMHEEASAAIADSLGGATCDTSVQVGSYTSVFSIIARLNARVLVGVPLCRDQEWLLVSAGFPQDSVAVANDLRPYHYLLRPFVYPFLSSAKRLRNDYAIAYRKLTPLIKERRNSSRTNDRPMDVLQWMLDLGTDADQKVHNVVGKLLFVTMASFHASTTAAVHVLYDLCAYPEYIELLREEIKRELEMEDGEWTYGLLTRLKKLDSFIKESQRMNAPGLLSFNRKVMKPLTLLDGTRLPQGATVAAPVHHVTHDPSVWNNPNSFDGFRFYHLRQAHPENEAEFQFAAVNTNSLGFGYGRFACPGRVFAAAQLKLIIGLLIMNYDISLQWPGKGSSERPANIFIDELVLPDRSVELVCRKR